MCILLILHHSIVHQIFFLQDGEIFDRLGILQNVQVIQTPEKSGKVLKICFDEINDNDNDNDDNDNDDAHYNDPDNTDNYDNRDNYSNTD